MSYQDRLISRAAWGAAPARSATFQPIRDTDLTVHWEGPAMGILGEAHDVCYRRVRSIQAYHLGTGGFSDIAYNWVVCQHGFIFMGRGPDVLTGANGYSDANWASKAVCYLGGVGDPFTEDSKAALRDLGAFHISQGGTSTRWCHRDWVSTACPGDSICPWVKAPGSWDTQAPTPPPEEDEEVAELIFTKRGAQYNGKDAYDHPEVPNGARVYVTPEVPMNVNAEGFGLTGDWENVSLVDQTKFPLPAKLVAQGTGFKTVVVPPGAKVTVRAVTP